MKIKVGDIVTGEYKEGKRGRKIIGNPITFFGVLERSVPEEFFRLNSVYYFKVLAAKKSRATGHTFYVLAPVFKKPEISELNHNYFFKVEETDPEIVKLNPNKDASIILTIDAKYDSLQIIKSKISLIDSIMPLTQEQEDKILNTAIDLHQERSTQAALNSQREQEAFNYFEKFPLNEDFSSFEKLNKDVLPLYYIIVEEDFESPFNSDKIETSDVKHYFVDPIDFSKTYSMDAIIESITGLSMDRYFTTVLDACEDDDQEAIKYSNAVEDIIHKNFKKIQWNELEINIDELNNERLKEICCPLDVYIKK